MNIRDELAEAVLDRKRLAEEAGVDYGYLRQLSAGNQSAGPDRLRPIALAMIAHARRLLTIAARLLAAAGDSDAARQARDHAANLAPSSEGGSSSSAVP